MRKTVLSLFLVMTLLLTALPAVSLAGKPPTLADLHITPGTLAVDLGEIRVKELEPLMALLDQHPQLEKVDMFESPVNRKQVEELSARYPRIQFGWTLKLVEKHLVRTDATAYAINHNNRSDTHSSEDFELLRYCKELRALDLGHNAITDLSFLKELKELRVLILACNKITDISPLRELRELEYLELFNNYIEDFRPLSALHKLIDLNICFNRGENIEALGSLQALERLWLYNSNKRSADSPVDPERVATLQAMLPDCHIDHTHYSTLGGWRTHERYYVVFNMLHGAVAYLPWDAEGLVPRYN